MARRSRRSLWTAKVLGQLPAKSREDDASVASSYQKRPYQGIILGIDSSLRGTGLALVDFTGAQSRLLHSRTVKLKPKVPFAQCLAAIFLAVQDTLSKAPVRHVAIEATIFVQNRKAVHILGAARGAAIAAAAVNHLEVFDYAPRRVKQSIVGRGGASKEQVAAMVAQHLGCVTLPLDEADAAATALCHAFTWKG